eukprot:3046760-Rhodomonas_salina.1
MGTLGVALRGSPHGHMRAARARALSLIAPYRSSVPGFALGQSRGRTAKHTLGQYRTAHSKRVGWWRTSLALTLCRSTIL